MVAQVVRGDQQYHHQRFCSEISYERLAKVCLKPNFVGGDRGEAVSMSLERYVPTLHTIGEALVTYIWHVPRRFGKGLRRHLQASRATTMYGQVCDVVNAHHSAWPTKYRFSDDTLHMLHNTLSTIIF